MNEVKMSAALYQTSPKTATPAYRLDIESEFFDSAQYYLQAGSNHVTATPEDGVFEIKCLLQQGTPGDPVAGDPRNFVVRHRVEMGDLSFWDTFKLLRVILCEGTRELAKGIFYKDDMLRLGNGTVTSQSEADGNSRPW
jgi:hypothetical protein